MQILRKLNKDTAAEVYYAEEYARDIIRRRRSNRVKVLVRNLPFKDLAKYLRRHIGNIYVNKTKSSISFENKGKEILIKMPKKGHRYNPYYSLRDDARTKDFTINAMYISLDGKRKKVIDFYHGRSSIRQRQVRIIGKADVAIRRKPILMMRAISLATDLNYHIDSNLFYAIRANQALIEKAQTRKIRTELISIILSNKPARYLQILHNSGLLSHIIPELSICVHVDQNERYHKYDVFNHCLLACEYMEPDLILRLAALLHDVGKPQVREETIKKGVSKVTFYNHEVMSSKLAKKILRRLGFKKEIVSTVSELIYNHMYNYEPSKWSDTAVRRFISKAGISEKDLGNLGNLPIFLLRKADRAANGLDLSKISPRQHAFQKHIREVYAKSKAIIITDLDINGTVIMKEFNLKPGPTIGHILSYLLSLVIEDQKMNTREKLIEEASKYLSGALK